LQVAESTPALIEWSVFDTCVDNLLSSRKPLKSFLSPNRLAKFAESLIREAQQVPTILSTFFLTPTIDPLRLDEGRAYKSEIKYTSVDGWNLYHLSQYCLMFLKELSGSDDINEQLNFIRYFDGPHQRMLKNTVLVNELWIAFYNIFSDSVLNYHVGRGYPLGRTMYSPILDASRYLAKHLERTDGSLLIAKCIGIDRYCKLSMYQAFRRGVPVPNFAPYTFAKRHEQDGPVERTQIPSFEHVPYLRRFRVGGKLYITSFVVQLK